MRRQRVVMVLAGAAAVWCAAPLAVTAAPGAGAVARAGTWRTAIEVPGLGSLNKGGWAWLPEVSCRSAGNCAAAGYYTDGSVRKQAFVAGERNGTWHTAIEVPGSGTLNAGAGAATSVSCASAGNCAAGGFYTDGSNHQQAFVASEKNGTWHTAIEVPGSGTLNAWGYASVESVSCASAGNCAAGGYYTDGPNSRQAFVVSEKNGTWGKAIEIPHLGALNMGEDVQGFSVSCGAAGNCVAGGDYLDSQGGDFHGFVVSETNGVWGQAKQLPGFKALNARSSHVSGISCPSPSHCAADGAYQDRSGHEQGFVVSQR
jgi:hypothetical protein